MRRLHICGYHITRGGWCISYMTFACVLLYLITIEFHIFGDKKYRDLHYIRNSPFRVRQTPDLKRLNTVSNSQIMIENSFLPKPDKERIDLTFISDNSEFKKYIQPRNIKVTPINYKFVIPGQKICKKPPYVLIVCISEPLHIEERSVIRETWGNWTNNTTRDGYEMPRVQVVFMFGSPGNSSAKSLIMSEENRLYGDVIMADFEESYHNLTRKVLSALRWSIEYCNKIKFLLKVDEDTFIHIPNLLRFLKTVHVPKSGMIIGHAEFKHKVLRSGRWPLNESVYPFEDYPPYVSGNSYVISGNIIDSLVKSSEFLPYIYIEDAFITGILREAIGAELRHRAGFTWWTERHPRLCSFHNKHRLSATNTSPSLTKLLWKALQHNLTNCYDPTTLQKLEFYNTKKNSHILLGVL